MNSELEAWLWRNPAYEADDPETYIRELKAGRRPLDQHALNAMIEGGVRPIEPQVEFSAARWKP